MGRVLWPNVVENKNNKYKTNMYIFVNKSIYVFVSELRALSPSRFKSGASETCAGRIWAKSRFCGFPFFFLSLFHGGVAVGDARDAGLAPGHR